MAKRSLEDTLANKFVDAAVRMDFDPDRFGFLLSQCGSYIQVAMFKAFLSMINHWAIDWDNNEDKGSADYQKVTRYAMILQRTVDHNTMYDL